MREVGTDFVIERAHRFGRLRSDSKPRKIVAQFLIYKDRETVFKVARNKYVRKRGILQSCYQEADGTKSILLGLTN